VIKLHVWIFLSNGVLICEVTCVVLFFLIIGLWPSSGVVSKKRKTRRARLLYSFIVYCM
jgi:hypothetical protein